MDYAEEEGVFSQELMNGLMMRGGEQEEARVLKEHNMDPDKNPLAYTVIMFDNVVSKNIPNLIMVKMKQSEGKEDHGDEMEVGRWRT